MCGRFTLQTNLNEIFDRFDVFNTDSFESYQLRYNIAPSQDVLAVVNDGEKNRLGYLRWGLVPPWAKDAKIGYKMINARAETLTEKVSFKQAFKRRRCLVIADGFYEWKRNGTQKTPMRIHLQGEHPFAMAGLWEKWKSPTGEEMNTCTVVTTAANQLMAPIHDRMPVILKPEHESIWLDRTLTDTDYLSSLLQAYPDNEMNAYEVSSEVNTPKNEHADLVKPV